MVYKIQKTDAEWQALLREKQAEAKAFEVTRHVSKGGLIGVFVVLGAALLYLVIPGILSGFLGDGCVTR